MKYIIQIFTGGWHNQNYTPEQIIGRLETVTSRIPVQSVILGWNINKELYKTVNTYLSSKQIESFLWLPVFSAYAGAAQASASVSASSSARSLRVVFMLSFLSLFYFV